MAGAVGLLGLRPRPAGRRAVHDVLVASRLRRTCGPASAAGRSAALGRRVQPSWHAFGDQYHSSLQPVTAAALSRPWRFLACYSLVFTQAIAPAITFAPAHRRSSCEFHQDSRCLRQMRVGDSLPAARLTLACERCAFGIDGWGGRDRTYNLRSQSPSLCQLSYAPI